MGKFDGLKTLSETEINHYVVHMVSSVFSDVFGSVSNACLSVFICLHLYVASVAFEYFKSRSNVASEYFKSRSGVASLFSPSAPSCCVLSLPCVLPCILLRGGRMGGRGGANKGWRHGALPFFVTRVGQSYRFVVLLGHSQCRLYHRV